MKSIAHPMVNGIHPYWGMRWAHKLRTTTVPQITGDLHNETGMCALGVLFNELMQDGLMLPWETRVMAGTPEAYAQAQLVASIVSDAVRETVIAMNDKGGATFHQIADYIDSLLEHPAPVDRATIDAYPALLAEQDDECRVTSYSQLVSMWNDGVAR